MCVYRPKLNAWLSITISKGLNHFTHSLTFWLSPQFYSSTFSHTCTIAFPISIMSSQRTCNIFSVFPRNELYVSLLDDRNVTKPIWPIPFFIVPHSTVTPLKSNICYCPTQQLLQNANSTQANAPTIIYLRFPQSHPEQPNNILKNLAFLDDCGGRNYSKTVQSVHYIRQRPSQTQTQPSLTVVGAKCFHHCPILN